MILRAIPISFLFSTRLFAGDIIPSDGVYVPLDSTRFSTISVQAQATSNDLTSLVITIHDPESSRDGMAYTLTCSADICITNHDGMKFTVESATTLQFQSLVNDDSSSYSCIDCP